MAPDGALGAGAAVAADGCRVGGGVDAIAGAGPGAASPFRGTAEELIVLHLFGRIEMKHSLKMHSSSSRDPLTFPVEVRAVINPRDFCIQSSS